MPTYEYRCNACGHRFEKLQKFSDDPIRTCPECGEDEAERLISPGAGLVFKGSGFYATDYGKSSPPRGGAKEAEGGGSGDGGDDGGGSGSSDAVDRERSGGEASGRDG